MLIREAIILAGGLGTRLRSSVPDLPKCMAPVAGKPFLHYLLRYLQQKGITRIIFSLGYKHEVIEEYLAEHFNNIEYTCVIEEEPLGTGGAIRAACSYANGASVLVFNGDTYFDVDLEGLSVFHNFCASHCTLALKPMQNFDRYGVVEVSKDYRIASFREKDRYESGTINGGVYALNKNKFLDEKLPVKFSFEKEYLESLYSDRRMYGYIQERYFIDIGIPEDFERAQVEFQDLSQP